jgi:hypothetical protein
VRQSDQVAFEQSAVDIVEAMQMLDESVTRMAFRGRRTDQGARGAAARPAGRRT